MDGLAGFFQYAKMRQEGKSDEEILCKITKDAEEDLGKKAFRIDELLRGAIAARKADGEDLAKKMEDSSDITAPARARIIAAKDGYTKLLSKVSEVEEVLGEMHDQMIAARVRKDLLSKKLKSLTVQLNSTTEEPKWMKPGTLEELRSRGKTYGDACSKY